MRRKRKLIKTRSHVPFGLASTKIHANRSKYCRRHQDPVVVDDLEDEGDEDTGWEDRMTLDELERRHIATLRAMATAGDRDVLRLSLEADRWRQLIQIELKKRADEGEAESTEAAK